MPQKAICFWKTSDMKALPWSWLSARPRAAPAPRWVAEPPADRHADGLGRLEAGAALGHVPAQQLGIPMLGRAEQPHLAVLGGGHLGGVGGPHHVRRFGSDVPLVRRLRSRVGPVRREQGVLAHQPQHPLARDADAVQDRKSTRLNSSHANISYAVFCLKKKY